MRVGVEGACADKDGTQEYITLETQFTARIYH